jgi:hypothetical protein
MGRAFHSAHYAGERTSDKLDRHEIFGSSRQALS